MQLNEFLNKSISSTQLPIFLTGKLNIKVNDYILDLTDDEIIFDPSIIKDTANTVNSFDELLDIYGWRINFLLNDKLVIRKSKDTFNSTNDFASKFKGLYLKGSTNSIDIIHRTGFRPAKFNELADDSIKLGPIYNEARVYLWSLEAIASNKPTELAFWDDLETTIENCRAYGKYIYIVDLPANIKVYKDPEYKSEKDGACFTTSNILPEYIELLTVNAKYSDTVNKLKLIINKL